MNVLYEDNHIIIINKACHIFIGNENYIATLSAVATVRATANFAFIMDERSYSVSAIPCFYSNNCSVNKHNSPFNLFCAIFFYRAIFTIGFCRFAKTSAQIYQVMVCA
jgi:hypothetical protein